MRDTPRTEVYVLDPLPQVVSADWARQLERELNAAKARVAELESRCKRLEELGAELRECAGYLGYAASNDSRCIARAERAVKAWNKEAKL